MRRVEAQRRAAEAAVKVVAAEALLEGARASFKAACFSGNKPAQIEQREAFRTHGDALLDSVAECAHFLKLAINAME